MTVAPMIPMARTTESVPLKAGNIPAARSGPDCPPTANRV